MAEHISENELATARLLVAITPSFVRRLLDRVMLWAWSHNETSGPWCWFGDACDTVSAMIVRLRARWMVRTGRKPRYWRKRRK